MTAIELKTSIAADLEQMSLEMLEIVSRYVKRLRMYPRATHVEEENLKLYTMDEINAMIDESERQIAAGLCQDDDDVFRELQEELEQEELALAYAEAV
ncbi:MAG: hypothetical protein IKZ55_03045 [Bacteroidales bacterium]|nr:hypothetical protein [Bacteroidales bacterium]